MGMSVRKAVLGDREVIVHNILRMALESEAVTLGMDRFLSDPSRGFYLLVRDHDQVVGQCMITQEFSDWRNGEYWWVQSIYVGEEHRRKGVLRAILDETRRLAKEQGDVFGIRLYVDRDNGNALEAYLRLGLPLSHYLMLDVPM